MSVNMTAESIIFQIRRTRFASQVVKPPVSLSLAILGCFYGLPPAVSLYGADAGGGLRLVLSRFLKTANHVSQYMKCHVSLHSKNDT